MIKGINRMKKTCLRLKILLIVAVIWAWFPENGFAQSSYIITATAGYDFTEEYLPVYDLTFIHSIGYGLRYSLIPNFEFSEDTEVVRDSNTISTYTITGDYEMPSLVYVIESKTFSGKSVEPFDFLSAYATLGYNDSKLTVNEIRYTAVGGQIQKESFSKETKIPVYAVSFGFLGGDKFVVMDAKLVYIRGKLDDQSVVDRSIEFSHWLMVLSLGLGF